MCLCKFKVMERLQRVDVNEKSRRDDDETIIHRSILAFTVTLMLLVANLAKTK